MMVFLLVGEILKDLKINTTNRMSKLFNIHDWQAKQRLAEQNDDRPQSMSSASVRALQTVVSDYSLNTILTNIADIANRTGQHDEADMIKNLASKINNNEDPRMDPAIRSDFDDPVMDEQNTTGTGASFSAGNSPAYATPKAFGKKKDKDIEVLGYKKI